LEPPEPLCGAAKKNFFSSEGRAAGMGAGEDIAVELPMIGGDKPRETSAAGVGRCDEISDWFGFSGRVMVAAKPD